jgi:hypothetical protein
MNTGRTIFAQLMDLVPLPEFRRCVERYRGDYKSQSFSALDQFLCLAFAQLTYRQSLRDTRARVEAQYYRRRSHPVDPSTGVRCDQTIALTGPKTSRRYPDPLRRIHYFDAERDLRLIFLTNNFPLPALVIAQLYRARWRVELFFRWIKQHLRIKAFYATSENAVKIQVWFAVSMYELVAILKKRLALDLSLYTILQILSTSVFEKTAIREGLFDIHSQPSAATPGIQLPMFNFSWTVLI